MTREEVVRFFERLKVEEEKTMESLKNGLGIISSAHQRFVEAYDIAISALREQEERSKGCECCANEENDIPLPTDTGYTWISGNKLQNSYGECEIKFCPMCGRRLEEL